MATKLNKNLTGTQITDELHSSVGSDYCSLDHDTFFGSTDMVIRTVSGGGGTQLVEDTDYTLHDEDTTLTADCSKTVYTTYKIINPTYQTVDLYFTYKSVGDYTEAGDINALQALIDALELKHNLLHIEDQQPAGTAGGTFTAGAWRTRALNTVLTNEISGASLVANQIILSAGTYIIHSSAPVYAVNANQSRLYNITDGVTIKSGSSNSANADGASTSRSIIEGRFSLDGIKTLEIQHQCQTTKATFGLGVPGNFGEIEVYTIVAIYRVA